VFSSEVVAHHNQHTLQEINSSILITFDDGWAGIYQNAHPLLKKYGMKATAFVQTNDINKNTPSRCSWNSLRIMALSGTWEIHSHSASHANLTELSDQELTNEMNTSINHFHQNGFIHNLYIAYPFGSNNVWVQEEAKHVGYKAGFAALPKIKITQQDELYALPRSTICQLFDQPMICKKLGLNLNTIRSKIAIFDETEGEWTGNWQHHFFHDDAQPGYTCGQIGYRYALSQSREASWQVTYEVKQPGFYSLSTWTPAMSAQQPGIHIWEIVNNGNQRLGAGSIHHKKQNAWTTLNTIWLNKGKITLRLKKDGEDQNPLLVDAVKIEKLQ
jgi:peptidoglycan/xylan/chitin deacetylase (PgdA/CDA1 family)